jgi:CTP synthase (UTP-ammonia lyase)
MQVPDVCFVELGGTVGDIESSVYLEALRQLRVDKGEENVVVVSSHQNFI